jgi:putative transposase
MNREMLKEIMSNMDVVKELDEYGKNRLASLMEGLLIEIMGKERYEYLLENHKECHMYWTYTEVIL